MCGIAGIFAYGTAAPPVDRVELLRIRDRMQSRGPDGSGLWLSEDGRLGLAHRRLAIIDLTEDGAQPMVSAEGHQVVSFNGEIYNYRELRRELEAEGYRFHSASDTEVLLHLYAREGQGMLARLRGMFAFAIWDGVKRGLLLARDPFGIKPLYYADDGGALRFASQVKALLAGGCVDTSPDPAGHAGFFLWGSTPEPCTLYRGIRSLKAGYSLWITEGGAEAPRPFCRIEEVLAEAASQPAQGSRVEALEAIGAALRGSIRAHLVADVPVGMFLSAGLDSAMITALSVESLRAAASERPHSLTLAFAEYAGTVNDESPMAEKLAASLGTRHATLMVRREDFEEDREKLLSAMDQPTIDGVNTWFVARAAASQGIKVALSGVGGDELFASYPSFAELPRMVRLARPVAQLPGVGKGVRRMLAPVVARLSSPKYASLGEYGGTLGGAYLLRRSLHLPWELPQMMDADMARQGLDELQTLANLDHLAGDARFTARPAAGSRAAITALEMCCYMRNQLLRDTDWTGMAHSLEIRVPLLDVALLKAVAPWLAAHPGLTKAEVAAAVAKELPSALLHKPKTGFSIPVRDWLLKDRPAQQERGMRGWARFIYSNFTGAST